MDFKTHKIPGELPEMWNRSVIFFANILSLFYGNDCEINVLREKVGTLETYGSRLIPIINLMFQKHSNILLLERPPERSLLHYFTSTLNLSLPEIKVLTRQDYLSIGNPQAENNQKLEELLIELRKTEAQWIDGYVTESQLIKIGEKTNKKPMSSLNGSHRGNNKVLLHQHLEKSGLPTFDTSVAENTKDIKKYFKTLNGKGYQSAVVKASIGASGIGMIKIDFAKDRYDIPEYLFYEGPCLVQGWLDQSVAGVRYIGSPSVQLFIKDDCLTLHDITEQILSIESIHEGNISPPSFLEYKAVKNELLNQAEVAGTWLYNQGYRGTGSADFHVVEREGKFEVRVCEVNARVTGGTYPSLLAHQFMPNGVWLMRNIRFSPPPFAAQLLNLFQQDGSLFEPEKNSGILPINLNPDHQGKIVKGQFLFLGETHHEVFSLLQSTVSENKSFKGVYDRD